MEKGNRGISKNGLRRGGQPSRIANFQFLSFLKNSKLKRYATEKNIFMAIGIVSALGGLAFVAFKYVPWDRIKEKIEEELDSVQRGEFSPQTVDAL